MHALTNLQKYCDNARDIVAWCISQDKTMDSFQTSLNDWGAGELKTEAFGGMSQLLGF